MNNTLSPFFSQLATTMQTHKSNISELVIEELAQASKGKIVKDSNTVSQCSALPIAFSQTNNDLLNELELVQADIHWADSGGALKSPLLQQHLAFSELVGPTGMVLSNKIRVGLFFQNKEVDYPNHRHAAEELYLVLSGSAQWIKETEPHATTKAPMNFIHHKSWESHAMLTRSEPLLALWCWAGDIDFKQYEMVN